MKKTLTISNLFLVVSMMVAAIFTTRAYAAETFYIEIGSPASVEETRDEWQNLSKKYKSLLGKLTFYPKAIVNEQGETTNIIQAGPIEEKSRAQKICNSLFAKDIPCFVIEGIEKKPPTMSVGIAHIGSSSSRNLFSGLGETIGSAPQVLADGGNDSEQSSSETSQEQEVAQEGEVAVAQAIAVPLSDRTNDDNLGQIKVKAATSNKPIENVRVKNFSPIEFTSRENGGLIIEKFPTEKSAKKFWGYVKDNHPDDVDGLKIHIQRDLFAGKDSGIQIKVYPFANGDDAAAFCAKAVNDFGSVLECHYEANNALVSDDAEYKRGDSYAERRQLTQRRVPAQQAEIQTNESLVAVSDLAEKEFWAQVAIADSKDEAMHRWKEIQKKNSATVKGIASKLASSSSAYAKYSIRLGAFENEDDANALCNKLQMRGVDCLVVSTN